MRSVAQNDCKCLIRFHNCTPYRIIPFWIDFKGLPIKYPVLAKGAYLNIDTYASHLWFFKIDKTSEIAVKSVVDSIKILAITEEAINSSIDMAHLKSHYVNKVTDGVIRNDRMSGLSNILVCSMCKYILQEHSLTPAKVPCPHFTGEAKFSVSDLQGKSWSSHNNSYIYSCSTHNHRLDHASRRRNIYLVEPFYNLRERCFLALADNIRHLDVLGLDIPISLQLDYYRFHLTLDKIEKHNRLD